MAQLKGILCGIFAALVTIIVLITFGTQTSIEVFSYSRFQNFLVLFFILEITSVAVEFAMDSKASDVAVDTVVAIIVALLTTIISAKKETLLFTGNIYLFELVKKMILPGSITILFACLGSSHVSKALNKSSGLGE